MSLNNFSTELHVVSVNGREMTDWGETDPPYTSDPIDPKTTLRRGQGGNAIRLDRKNPGRSVSMFFNPGGPDAAYMQGLFNSNANIEISVTQIGTLEASVGVEGAIVNDGSQGRGGQTITDDLFIMEFNGWTGAKGGE